MKYLYSGWLACILTLSACAQLGLAPATSFDAKWAYAYGTYNAVVSTAASATTAGTLKKTDAQSVLDISDKARTLLDDAKTVYDAKDAAGANDKLALATAILTQLQTFLKTKGVT